IEMVFMSLRDKRSDRKLFHGRELASDPKTLDGSGHESFPRTFPMSCERYGESAGEFLSLWVANFSDGGAVMEAVAVAPSLPFSSIAVTWIRAGPDKLEATLSVHRPTAATEVVPSSIRSPASVARQARNCFGSAAPFVAGSIRPLACANPSWSTAFSMATFAAVTRNKPQVPALLPVW